MKKERQNSSKAGSLRRKGVLLVTGAMLLTGLFGVLAIATDVGYFLYLKRRIQAATDASVMAAVQGFRRGDCSSPSSTDCDDLVTAYALNGSERNGFTNGVNNITVTVNHPPASGPYSTNPLVVEVITCQSHPTFFMPIMGTYEATACARASAGYIGESGRLHLRAESDRRKVAACPQHHGHARRPTVKSSSIRQTPGELLCR